MNQRQQMKFAKKATALYADYLRERNEPMQTINGVPLSLILALERLQIKRVSI
jgi:hypothetical protein